MGLGVARGVVEGPVGVHAEQPVDVLEQAALHCTQTAGQEQGGEIRPAPTQQHGTALSVPPAEAGHDDHRYPRQQLLEAPPG